MDDQEVIAKDESDQKSSDGALVVDLGKRQSRKRINQLRKGKGKLLDKIQQTISELRERKQIDQNAPPFDRVESTTLTSSAHRHHSNLRITKRNEKPIPETGSISLNDWGSRFL